jgi:hypothetical protein
MFRKKWAANEIRQDKREMSEQRNADIYSTANKKVNKKRQEMTKSAPM